MYACGDAIVVTESGLIISVRNRTHKIKLLPNRAREAKLARILPACPNVLFSGWMRAFEWLVCFHTSFTQSPNALPGTVSH